MFQDTQVKTILKLVGVAAIIALLSYTYYAFVQAQQVNNFPVSINVEGKGEVFVKPDIASFTFTVSAKESDAQKAQEAQDKTMSDINAYLKEKGVEEKDVKTTSYSMNPRYEYPDTRCFDGYCPPQGEPKVIGYEVSQSVTVKVRKTEDAGMLIAGVGEKGAENVGGLSFTIDDEEKYKAEARALAIADAEEKGAELADKLDVTIVRMTGYWENNVPPVYGYGGGMAMDMAMTKEAAMPVSMEVPMGENTITVMVNITYEVE